MTYEKINFDVWQPDESDRDDILSELWCYCKGTRENCGDGIEFQEAKELYENVSQNSLSVYKDDVQEFFADMYHAVGGEIEKYYSAEPEFLALLKKILGLS